MVTVTRIIVIDDHPVMRAGLLQLLDNNSEFVVCADAGDSAGALAAIEQHRPDIAIIDLSLPDGDGIELTSRLRQSYPDMRILVLSAHDETIFADRMLLAGANGYLMKGAPASEILTALRVLRDGGSYLSEAAASRVARRAYRRKVGSAAQGGSLSAREQQILTLLAEGLTPAAIAERLGIAAKTVYSHLDHVRDKLGLGSIADMMRYAVLLGSRSETADAGNDGT
jgi:DNA-binding NarL/FixJ family response regulator